VAGGGRRSWGPILLVVLGLVACRSGRPADSAELPGPAADPQVTAVTLLTENGGRVDWHPGRNLIVFDRSEGGPYEIFVMAPDGSGQTCLTCGRPGAPPRHKGNPAWHPSGAFIAFIAEKAHHRGTALRATPGIGIDNDLWIMTGDGQRYSQITAVPPGMGVLHPQFSHDGTRLVWAERVAEQPPPSGTWVIRLAEFVVQDGLPAVRHIQSFQPAGPAFYETHGFSPDDTTLLFSANPEPGQPFWGLDIYAWHRPTQTVRRLTTTLDQWDEHAHYSPDGRFIVWMSSMGCRCDPSRLADLRTDYWIMAADGTHKRRLTFFNEPGHPHAQGESTVAGDFAWGPNGRQIAAYIIGKRRLIDLLRGLRGGDRQKIVRLDLSGG